MENIGNFLSACELYGLKKGDMFQTVDLYEDQNIVQVLICISALGRKVNGSFSTKLLPLPLTSMGCGVTSRGVWCYIYGVWCYIYGVWCYIYGVWCYIYGVWCYVFVGVVQMLVSIAELHM